MKTTFPPMISQRTYGFRSPDKRPNPAIHAYRYSEHVRWVLPLTIEGWEHGETNEGLKIIARKSSWEESGIDPVIIEKNHTERFRVVDGHHRLNAALSVNPDAPIPVIEREFRRNAWHGNAIPPHTTIIQRGYTISRLWDGELEVILGPESLGETVCNELSKGPAIASVLKKPQAANTGYYVKVAIEGRSRTRDHLSYKVTERKYQGTPDLGSHWSEFFAALKQEKTNTSGSIFLHSTFCEILGMRLSYDEICLKVRIVPKW